MELILVGLLLSTVNIVAVEGTARAFDLGSPKEPPQGEVEIYEQTAALKTSASVEDKYHVPSTDR